MDQVLFENTKAMHRIALNVLKIREKEILAVSGIENLIPFLRKGVKGTEFEDNEDLFYKICA